MVPDWLGARLPPPCQRMSTGHGGINALRPLLVRHLIAMSPEQSVYGSFLLRPLVAFAGACMGYLPAGCSQLTNIYSSKLHISQPPARAGVEPWMYVDLQVATSRAIP